MTEPLLRFGALLVATGMRLAQVVAVRLGVRGQRADDGGRVGVDVGQRRHGGRCAGGAGAAPEVTHPPDASPSGARRTSRRPVSREAQ